MRRLNLHLAGRPSAAWFCSIRSTTRITGAAKNTIQGLTRDLGEECLKFCDNNLRNLNCKRIECDEIWNRPQKTSV